MIGKSNQIKMLTISRPPGSPPHRPVRGCLLGQSLRGPALPSLHPAGPGHTQAESQQEKEQQQQ